MVVMRILRALALASSASALRLSGAPFHFPSPNASTPPNCSPGTPKVPAELWNVGVQLFGSAEKLEAFAAKAQGPCKLTLDGVDMQLVDNADDASGVEYLRDEWPSGYVDLYGFRKVEKEDALFVDIGANIGDTPIFVSKVKPKMQMIAFEPVPPTYFLCLWNLHLNGVPTLSKEDIGKPNKPGVLALNEAVGNGEDIEVQWFPECSVCGKTGGGPPKGPGRGKPESRKVPTMQLPAFLKSHGIGSIQHMKVDCEGCEYFVMPAMKESIESKLQVERFAVEVHPFACPSKERKQEVVEIMDKRGCAKSDKDQVDIYVC